MAEISKHCTKPMRPVFILSKVKSDSIHVMPEGHFLDGIRVKRVCVLCMSQNQLLILKSKMHHNFSRKFDYSSHSDPFKEITQQKSD